MARRTSEHGAARSHSAGVPTRSATGSATGTGSGTGTGIATDPAAPPAIVVAGPPGSGKTSLASQLASELGYDLADLDAPDGRDEDVGHPPWRRQERYEGLIALAERSLRAGRGVIVVAPFTSERGDPATWQALVARLASSWAAGPGAATHRPRIGRPQRRAAEAVGVALVFLDCPPVELLRRLAGRNAARDRDKLADPVAWSLGPALDPPVVAHLAVDATLPPRTQLLLALGGLARGDGVTTASVTRATTAC